MKLDISNFNKQEELSAGDIIQFNFDGIEEAFMVIYKKGSESHLRLLGLNGKDYLEDFSGTSEALKEKLDTWFREKGWRYDVFPQSKFKLSLNRLDEVRA